MKRPPDLNFPPAAVNALVEIVRKRVVNENDRERAREMGWDPTVKRKELELRIAELEHVRSILLTDSSLYNIHDDRQNIDDAEGYPVKRQGHRELVEIAADLADVQESIRAAIAELPHPRLKRGLPIAALGFMYLWLERNNFLPTISVVSPAVKVLVSICERAGIPLDPDTVSRALSAAIKECDRHQLPWELDDLASHLNRPDLSRELPAQPILGNLKHQNRHIEIP